LLFGYDDIGSVAAKLMAKFALQVGVDSQYRGCDGGHNRHREQRGHGTILAHPGGSYQQPHQEPQAAQASPRKTTAGSKRMALRTAPALPRNVTASAVPITTAITTGWTGIEALKILSPMRCASAAPAKKPIAPPARAINPASVRKREATATLLA